jgi:hypothetical protein
VLVDHLGDGITEQNHILVEGLDMSLELDPVDQVDGDRDVFLAQCVKEWVL